MTDTPEDTDDQLLEIGFAKTDVTPPEPIDLRQGRYEGPEDKYADPYVRAMTIDDGSNRAVIVTAEILNWSQEVVDGFREGLKDRYDLDPDQILLNASHTHEGPSRSATEYLEYLVEQGIETVGAALDRAEPARLYFGRGEFGEIVNRRGLTREGYFARIMNFYGRTDAELIVLKAVDADGEPLGFVANFACHPTLVRIGKLGIDFTGTARDVVEADLGEDAVGLFLMGTAGDVKPPNRSEEKPGRLRFGYEGGMEKLEAFAGRFADAIRDALDSDLVEVSGDLRTDLDTVDLPLVEDYVDEVDAEPPFDGPKRRWARLARMMDEAMDENGEYEETHPCEVYVFEIGDDFVTVALNGEPNVPLGLRIKSQLENRSAMVLGYTGPSAGYIPGYAQLPESGYEMSNPFSPEAEDFLVDKVMDMVSEGSEMFWLESDDVTR